MSPSIEPINIFLTDLISKKLRIVSSNQATKVIYATARIIPGSAYPDMDIVVKKFNVLLFEILLP